MNTTSQSVSRWAVLIGINFYGGEDDLRGAVHDVSIVKDYLESGPDPFNITILTATCSPDANADRPTEDEALWPTFDNVCSSLKHVVENTNPGDRVLIYYAGHGNRRLEKKCPESAHQNGNLSLVLLHIDDGRVRTRHLPGFYLAQYLKQMVDKNLIVSVVLDCCFSGSVLRNGNIPNCKVRAIEFNPDADGELPDVPPLIEETSPYGPSREGQLADKWMVDPNGYTILTACGPHEIAGESRFPIGEPTGEFRGQLSYRLMEALGSLHKHIVGAETLYEQLCIRFRERPQQTPMLYGRRDLSILGDPGSLSVKHLESVYVYKTGNSLQLDAGQAHGVYKDDRYSLSSADDSDSQPSSQAIIAKVESVHALTSELSLELTSEMNLASVQTGWIAKPLTALPRQNFSVSFPANVYRQLSLTFKDAVDLNWLHVCSSDEEIACNFHVSVNDNEHYVILDGFGEEVRSLPTIPVDVEDALELVVNILQHVARFKYVEGLKNHLPNTSFESSFSLTFSHDRMTENGAPGIPHVNHEDAWSFTITSRSESTLYLTIFDLTSSWRICNLLSDAKNPPYAVVQPGETMTKRIRMTVPERLVSHGEAQCEEVFKFIITDMPTSFPSMVLPYISPNPPYIEVQRGEVETFTLSEQPDGAFRAGELDVTENWATQNLIVRTKKPHW